MELRLFLSVSDADNRLLITHLHPLLLGCFYLFQNQLKNPIALVCVPETETKGIIESEYQSGGSAFLCVIISCLKLQQKYSLGGSFSF